MHSSSRFIAADRHKGAVVRQEFARVQTHKAGRWGARFNMLPEIDLAWGKESCLVRRRAKPASVLQIARTQFTSSAVVPITPSVGQPGGQIPAGPLLASGGGE